MNLPLGTIARAIAAAACTHAGSLSAHAQTTWLVSNDPSENPDFVSLAQAFASSSVMSGDTVEVSAGIGPYVGSATLTKQLFIVAQEGEDPELRPSGMVGGTPAIHVNFPGPPGIVIEGVTFKLGTGTNGAISLGTTGTIIRDCTFEGFSRGCVGAGQSAVVDGCRFVDCIVNGGQNGATLNVSRDSRVINCEFVNTNPTDHVGYFIRANELGVVVEGCTFQGAPVGYVPFIGQTARATFIGCTFKDADLRPDQRLFWGNLAPLSFDSCLFTGINSSGQPLIYLDDDAYHTFVRNCTVTNCTAPSFSGFNPQVAPGHVTVQNSIFWDNAFTTTFSGPTTVAQSMFQT